MNDTYQIVRVYVVLMVYGFEVIKYKASLSSYLLYLRIMLNNIPKTLDRSKLLKGS